MSDIVKRFEIETGKKAYEKDGYGCTRETDIYIEWLEDHVPPADCGNALLGEVPSQELEELREFFRIVDATDKGETCYADFTHKVVEALKEVKSLRAFRTTYRVSAPFPMARTRC